MASPIDWQITKKEVKQRGEHLLETGQWSDCSFIVGTEPHQQMFYGHKLFLAMSSPVFEAMFYGGMAEKNDPISILDVQPDAFKALLEYIYTDKINLQSFDQACELCYIAKKYMLPHLVKECTNYIWSDLYPKNACRAYEFAKLFEEPNLMEKCLQIICTQTKEVLSESSFEDIEISTLETVFDQECLIIDSELDLFKAVSRYASKNGIGDVVVKKHKVDDGGELASSSSSSSMQPPCEDGISRKSVRPALMKIRFLTLTAQQFAEGPASSDLLTKDEKFSILMNISSPLCQVSMPPGFTTCTRLRKRKFLQYEEESSTSTTFFNSSSQPRQESLDHSYCDPYVDVQTGSMDRYMRNTPKLYCNRTLLSHNDCLNTSILDCSTMFSVDKNICIIGVQVPAQVPGEGSESRRLPSGSYNELLYAYLVDNEGSRLTYLHYSARVDYWSLIELTFNRPVYIQRQKLYKVGVVFNKTGWYPMGPCVLRSIVENITFTFGRLQNNTSVRDGLIRSIIFSY